MLDWVTAIILGIIEGVSEFLPISSTGHLLIAQHWLPRQSDLYNVFIQCAAVLAVMAIFTDRIKQLCFGWKDPEIRDYLLKLTTAFVITGAGGLILKKLDFELPESAVPVAWTLLIGGVIIIAVEVWLKGKVLSPEITWRIAIAVGLSQLVAIVLPGTSRAGITIVVALVMGASRPIATEFSFLLGIPSLVAAGGLKLFEAYREPDSEPIHWGSLLLASLVSLITAFIAVKWLLRFIQTHTFTGFGWYRIALGLIILLLIA